MPEDQDMWSVIAEYVFLAVNQLSLKASGQSGEGLLFDLDSVL